MRRFMIFIILTIGIIFSNDVFSQSIEKKYSIFGNFDQLYYKNGIIYAEGWAASDKIGAPVKKVSIFINNEMIGAATLGSKRPDVVTVMKKANWLNSGWKIQVKKKMKKGIYNSHAIAFGDKNQDRRTFTFATKLIVE